MSVTGTGVATLPAARSAAEVRFANQICTGAEEQPVQVGERPASAGSSAPSARRAAAFLSQMAVAESRAASGRTGDAAHVAARRW